MLTIITPCCRPENLHKLFNSIQFDKIEKWIIVYDISNNRTYSKIYNNDKIIEVEYQEEKSVFGHGQRNYGMSLVSNGFIYFLDDDTIIHSKFWDIVEEIKDKKNIIVSFDQHNKFFKNELLPGDKLFPHQIDSASYIIDKSLIGDKKFNIELYYSDGLFVYEVSQSTHPEYKHIYFPFIACYYNYLKYEIF